MEVVLEGMDADGAGVQIQARGIEPLELEEERVPLESGRAVSLSWGVTSRPEDSRVVVRLNINNHGSTSSWIRCAFDDTGEAEIPVELVDALLARGASGFPTVSITRQSVGSSSISGGCMELAIRSTRTVAVEIDGLVSCNSEEECEDGETCSATRVCEPADD